MTVPAHPLCWPPEVPRAPRREAGRFKVTLAGALDNVRHSLVLFGQDTGHRVTEIVMSSNVTLGVAAPADPGVAVWFLWDEAMRCIPVDRYASVAANLQAIHHVLEARRTEARHGTLVLVRQSFAGFKALPAPAGESWREVLGITGAATGDVMVEAVREAHKHLVRRYHEGGREPDRARMAAINAARDAALRELGA